MRVDELDYNSVLTQFRYWAKHSASRYMCISTVHMVMETYDNALFKKAVNTADLVAADGVPVIWASRWRGLKKQNRVFAPALMVKLCDMAASEHIAVGLYGSTAETVNGLLQNLSMRFPSLNVSFVHSPPFRPLTTEEDDEIVRNINDSGVNILFIGLGCPKQELWMYEHRGRVKATMIGVGWAFEVIAGRSRTAPVWVQTIGMEWFWRLILNPRKLWRRHLRHNPRFVMLILLQLLGLRSYPLETVETPK